jgi:ABC-type polysaccharide/polyol phosphate export permease
VLRQVANLFRYRLLISSLVGRELKARYRGSVLGFFWSFINPLLLLLTYGLVFTYMLKGVRSAATEPYFLFLFCGILPWTWFSASLLESSGVLIAGGNLIKKVLFPAALLLPLPLLVQLLLTLGLALLVSALTVHFRDIQNILSHVLHLWFFATPVLYSYAEAGGALKTLLRFNPMTYVIVSYQQLLFEGVVRVSRGLMVSVLCGLLAYAAGAFVFERLRDTLPEEV